MPVLTAVAAAVILGASPDAHALALGRLAVQSALGEPLRAEIDVPEINADEAATLRVGVAQAQAFRAAGFEYGAVVADMQLSLQRRADGRYFIRATSNRAVNDPFVDLVIEASWSTGRIVRDYTMLFDPPQLRTPTAPQIVAPQVSPLPQQSLVTPMPRGSAQAVPSSRSTAPTPAPRPAATATPPATAPRTQGAGEQVTVKAGDTAGRLAAANKPANVSLDQMLVAMLQANPDAFINGNINRIKAGAVLDLPSADQASAVPAGEARQMLVAQSRDFNSFRRQVAENAPVVPSTQADRQSSGKVQANVQETRPSAVTPDKLTVSKGTPAKTNEDSIAKSRQTQDANTRVAELNKNIADLAKLQTPATAPSAGKAATGTTAPATTTKPAGPAVTAPPAVVAPPPPPAPAPPPPPPPAPVPAPAPAVVAPPTAPAVTTPASAPAEAPAPVVAASVPAVPAAPPVVAAASAPKPAAKAAPKAPPAPPPPEPTLVDELLENPLIPAAAGGLLLLLIGFGAYRFTRRRKVAQVDSSFLESRLQPDSFFGASGGQRVDTNEAAPSASSMVYSPSQLDAAGDVDPVAEADVYLAYGRDLQAEEILKEAMRNNPSRVAIHVKLLEIYAKRRDTKAFEQVAVEAYRLTNGTGEDWNKVCEMGQELDAGNPMYKPGGEPSDSMLSPATQIFNAAPTQPQPAYPEFQNSQPAVDLDLDLDFSSGDDGRPGQPSPVGSASENERTVAVQNYSNSQPAPLDMDFNLDTAAVRPPASTEPMPLSMDIPAEPPVPSLPEFTDSVAPAPSPAPRPAPAPAPASDSGLIEFDLGALSLDLNDNSHGSADNTAMTPLPDTGAGELVSEGPLGTKLALAEEFQSIGDVDGARALIEEVIAEASGELKSRAQRMLAQLG